MGQGSGQNLYFFTAGYHNDFFRSRKSYKLNSSFWLCKRLRSRLHKYFYVVLFYLLINVIILSENFITLLHKMGE